MTTCRCGSIPLSLEAKRPGRNRGRWYFKCPTGTCSFFQWDDSPYPFIRHPVEAYAAAQPVTGIRLRPAFNFRKQVKDTDTTLTKNKVHVAFSVLSSSLIGIKAESNLTLDPVIENIKDIKWSNEYDQWTIPATVTSYNIAIGSFPTEVPNLLIEIDPIPPTLLDSIIEATLLEAQNESINRSGNMTDVEQRWSEFVESTTFRSLRYPILQKAVSTGIERGGRVLIGNENGIGSSESAFALAKVYQEEWPALLICRSFLQQTFMMEAKSQLGLTDDQIRIVNPKDNRTEMFNQNYIERKRKRPAVKAPSTKTKTKLHRSYKKKMAERLSNEDYQSSSSSGDDSDEEEKEIIEIEQKPVLFYIVDYELAAKRRKDIAAKEFKVIICTDSHYLKSWMHGESKFISQLLQQTKRAILTNPCAITALPVNLFTQIQSISPVAFPDFDSFSKRYCDCKSTVFGINYNGRSNKHEFDHVMETNIWYCPRLEDLKKELPDVVRRAITIKTKRSIELQRQVQTLCEESKNFENDLNDQIDLIQELHKKTSELKKDLLPDYLDYIRATFRRPKIAIAYYNVSMFDTMKTHFDSKQVKFTHLNCQEGSAEVCEEYNKSHSVQIILLDMTVEDLDISLYSVDLVYFVDLPFDMAKLCEFESFFKSKERKGPLSIEYLLAMNTVDDYLWPIVKTIE